MTYLDENEWVWSGGRFSGTICWHTDLLEILPIVRLSYGYIKEIYEGEISFQIHWLIFCVSITLYTK